MRVDGACRSSVRLEVDCVRPGGWSYRRSVLVVSLHGRNQRDQRVIFEATISDASIAAGGGRNGHAYIAEQKWQSTSSVIPEIISYSSPSGCVLCCLDVSMSFAA